MYDVISFDNIMVIYPFIALFFMILLTISYTNHTESAMISVLICLMTSEHISHDMAL